MAPLFIGPTVLLVSKEPKAKEMLTTLRASPQMTLLGMFPSVMKNDHIRFGQTSLIHDVVPQESHMLIHTDVGDNGCASSNIMPILIWKFQCIYNYINIYSVKKMIEL